MSGDIASSLAFYDVMSYFFAALPFLFYELKGCLPAVWLEEDGVYELRCSFMTRLNRWRLSFFIGACATRYCLSRLHYC